MGSNPIISTKESSLICRVVQRKHSWLITKRSVVRIHPLLHFFHKDDRVICTQRGVPITVFAWLNLFWNGKRCGRVHIKWGFSLNRTFNVFYLDRWGDNGINTARKQLRTPSREKNNIQILSTGVMVAQQILVLFDKVRILGWQQTTHQLHYIFEWLLVLVW